jgi:cytochrome c oxidase assembly protein subunit 15
VVAYAVVGLGLWHCAAILRSPADGEVRNSAMLLAGGLLAQMSLGVVTLIHAVPIGLGIAHQGGAAIVLAIAVRHLWLVRQATNG